ncbi:MAG: COQ9 family protein [Pseudomonadota bacterium]|nr:COQ9 family protein [Pseudomonadota bacterium]
MTDTLDEIRDRLVTVALDHVAFDGWSDATLARAAEEAGVSRLDLYRAFPGGVEDALDHHLAMADRAMVSAILDLDLDAMKIREKITAAVRIRLEQAAPHKEAVRRGLQHLGLPFRGPRAMKALWRTADLIWRAIGDTSTDFNFYTKRTLLSGVYASTLMYWLNDTSPDHADTWAFLDRRIANVMTIEKTKGRLLKSRGGLPRPFESAARIGARLREARSFRR